MSLYYENRIPELQLTNQDLNEDMERLLEEAELDEEQDGVEIIPGLMATASHQTRYQNE